MAIFVNDYSKYCHFAERQKGRRPRLLLGAAGAAARGLAVVECAGASRGHRRRADQPRHPGGAGHGLARLSRRHAAELAGQPHPPARPHGSTTRRRQAPGRRGEGDGAGAAAQAGR